MEKKDILMTRAEIIKYLKISPATLTKLMKSRAFPFIKFEKSRRGKVLFKRADIDAFLESKVIR
jgi:excisionase family DNA binding protein